MGKFKNEPFTDFSQPAARRRMEDALVHVRRQLGQVYPLWIKGRKIHGKRTFESINPSFTEELIGTAVEANRGQADLALTAAHDAFPAWSKTSERNRAEFLVAWARKLRYRKAEFTAWLILEVGKSWSEADADVAEAIDFLEYYARQAVEPVPSLTAVPGERNVFTYQALGAVVVIPPWNFPLAILVGMTAAAVVAGNTVVLKPSSQSPMIAAKFVELVREDLPPGVLNLLFGPGGKIGDVLVQDPRTRMVAFTGSKEIGLRMNRLAAEWHPGQRWIKRVIAEMGGKNAILVDDTADLKVAAEGVAASAFSYQGQKCSACSRLYVHRRVYSDFMEKLLACVRGFRIGPAEYPENKIGPVISRSAEEKILSAMQRGRRDGRLLMGGAKADLRNGFYLEPTIIESPKESSFLWREEIFGPVLAVTPVKSFEEALLKANRTDFGLTGAVYSKDPRHLHEARTHFFCGNLYLNRKCTGALVGGHPFGGFNLSGTDSKAGGPGYVNLFRQAQCISERR